MNKFKSMRWIVEMELDHVPVTKGDYVQFSSVVFLQVFSIQGDSNGAYRIILDFVSQSKIPEGADVLWFDFKDDLVSRMAH